MSQLSKLFHAGKGEAFHSIISYLETVDLPKDTKASIVINVMKAVHVGEGNQWTPVIEAGVGYAIDYVLGELRGWAKSQDTPPATVPVDAPPVSASIYGTEHEGALPPDAELHTMGYKTGDVKWTLKAKTGWIVTTQGAVFDAAYADMVGLIQ